MPSTASAVRGRAGGLAGLLALVLVAGAGLGGAGPAAAGAATPLRGTIQYVTFRSSALDGTVHYSVYLPPDYAVSAKRYPVIYFLHGLPATATAYKGIQQIAEAVEASGREAIVIGAQGARSGDADPEWRNWGAGRNWETATAQELVSVVDSRYRTIARRTGRLLVGISAGGYGATLIALHNPGVYAVVESWSGYFHATNATGTAALDLGSRQADDWASAHTLIARAKRFLSAYGGRTYFAFCVGTDDSRFRSENEQFYRELERAGVSQAAFRLYSGGHDWSLWARHALAWLGKGLSVAEAPTR